MQLTIATTHYILYTYYFCHHVTFSSPIFSNSKFIAILLACVSQKPCHFNLICQLSTRKESIPGPSGKGSTTKKECDHTLRYIAWLVIKDPYRGLVFTCSLNPNVTCNHGCRSTKMLRIQAYSRKKSWESKGTPPMPPPQETRPY